MSSNHRGGKKSITVIVLEVKGDLYARTGEPRRGGRGGSWNSACHNQRKKMTVFKNYQQMKTKMLSYFLNMSFQTSHFLKTFGVKQLFFVIIFIISLHELVCIDNFLKNKKNSGLSLRPNCIAGSLVFHFGPIYPEPNFLDFLP